MTAVPRPPLPARLSPAQTLVLDCVVAAGYGLMAWFVVGSGLTSAWSIAGVVALVAAPLALGRRYPVAAVVVALAALCLSPLASDIAFAALAPVAYALYRVTVESRPATGIVVLAGCVAGSVTTALPTFDHRGAVIPFALVFVTTWTVGYAVKQQRAYVARLAEHHRKLAEAEIARARRRVVEGRLEMARELHDVVAHTMSVITVQAGYGHLVIDEQPAKAREALGIIETTGRGAMTEMRTLMSMLRRDDELSRPENAPLSPLPLTPMPGLGDLDALVADTARAGVTVDLVISGTPRDLPVGLDLSAYRIMQEALTNVVKHAGVAEARAVLSYGADALTIDVSDEGTGGPTCNGVVAPRGHGLIGMQERVSTYGGRLCAEPLPGKGYRVSASLPLVQVPT